MGALRGTVSLEQSGIDLKNMGVVYPVARPGKLCVADGVDGATQRNVGYSAGIGNGNDSLRRRPRALLIGVLGIVCLWVVQSVPNGRFHTVQRAPSRLIGIEIHEEKEKNGLTLSGFSRVDVDGELDPSFLVLSLQTLHRIMDPTTQDPVISCFDQYAIMIVAGPCAHGWDGP